MSARAEYDVVIIGARVAGAITAALLGDAGSSVLLVDRVAFPSPTVSTHFFRGAGLVSVLDRLGVLEAVLSLGCPPLVREYHYEEGSPRFEIGPPQEPGDIGYCLSVRRRPLDDLLVRRACRSESVELLERTRLSEVVVEDARAVGVRLNTPSGERAVTARLVVGADGRHSLVARQVRASSEVEDPPYRALYYRYVSSFPGADGGAPDGPEFSGLGDELAYVFPSDDGVVCVALSVNLSTFAWMRQSLSTRFEDRLSRHAGLWPRYRRATQESRMQGCGPEPNFVRRPIGRGWALVGDAGLHQDPWTGLGMDMAGTHAALLADQLVAWLRGDASEKEALSAYHQTRNETALEGYRSTVEGARDLRLVSDE
jgi:menaquinone-9 beta-reductase